MSCIVTMREMDTLMVEAQTFIQKVMEEYAQEVLGDRLEYWPGQEGEVSDAFAESETEGEDQRGAEDFSKALQEQVLRRPKQAKGRIA